MTSNRIIRDLYKGGGEGREFEASKSATRKVRDVTSSGSCDSVMILRPNLSIGRWADYTADIFNPPGQKMRHQHLPAWVVCMLSRKNSNGEPWGDYGM